MGGRRPRFPSARRPSGLTVLLLGVLLRASAARAESPAAAAVAEPFRVQWTASPGCGEAAIFLNELRSRTSRLRPARAGELAISLRVSVQGEAAGARGELTVRKPSGEVTVREVPGRNCQEVVSAMALIAALMVDPLAATSERLPTLPEPSTPEPLPPPSPARQRAFRLGLEQRLTARTAVAPGWAWGESLGLMLLWQKGPLRPSVELSAERALATISSSLGSAELTWNAAQLALCPWGGQPGARWDLRACAVFQLGSLRGVGYDTKNPGKASVLWSSAGLELQARFQLVEPLWLGVEAGLLRPFTRERFYVDPSQTLHRVPAWGTSAGAGLGLHFF